VVTADDLVGEAADRSADDRRGEIDPEGVQVAGDECRAE
jgi:hypothetical protein